MRHFNFSPKTQVQSLIRQNFRCACCGEDLRDTTDRFHHVVPDSVGTAGSYSDRFISTVENCVALCEGCHYVVHDSGNFRNGAVAPPAYFKYAVPEGGHSQKEWVDRIEAFWDNKFPNASVDPNPSWVSTDYSFNDLFKAAHGRDMLSNEHNGLMNDTLADVNAKIMQWCDMTKDTPERFIGIYDEGDAGNLYVAFTKTCVPWGISSPTSISEPDECRNSTRSSLFHESLTSNSSIVLPNASLAIVESKSQFARDYDALRSSLDSSLDIQITTTLGASSYSSNLYDATVRIEVVRNGNPFLGMQYDYENANDPYSMTEKARYASNLDYVVRPPDKYDPPRYAGH